MRFRADSTMTSRPRECALAPIRNMGLQFTFCRGPSLPSLVRKACKTKDRCASPKWVKNKIKLCLVDNPFTNSRSRSISQDRTMAAHGGVPGATNVYSDQFPRKLIFAGVRSRAIVPSSLEIRVRFIPGYASSVARSPQDKRTRPSKRRQAKQFT